MLSRPGFLDHCEQWRNRNIPDGILADIYDGRVWKEFKCVDGKPFLDIPYNFAFSVNIDWFQPFKHTTDSVGAIYLSILNLPRTERYKPENIILCGIIPGPSEPKQTINSYLYPLVQELLKLWKGVYSLSSQGVVLVRAALICVSCDLPATRKVCGFAAHSARLGCSKCLKQFPSLVNKLDYSGFDKSKWKARNISEHHMQSKLYLDANTKAQQSEVIKKYGVRYSVLLQLPYFDIVRFHVIDAMHNLLLGTAKHVTHTWIECGVLSNEKLQKIQDTVNAINSPVDVGRLPAKIASNYSGFTADQWRNWLCIYSPVALKNVIPSSSLRCWLLYVKAVSILCTRVITIGDVSVADQYLQLFCQEFQKLYGSQSCTPNMHLHLHLLDCILDYGPVYSFWCFAFERFNDMLGAFPTNSKQIEPQIMRKFLQQQRVCNINVSPEFNFGMPRLNLTGSMLQSISVSTADVLKLQSLAKCEIGLNDFKVSQNSSIHLIPPFQECILHDSEMEDLKLMYNLLYPEEVIKEVHKVTKLCFRMSLCGEVFSSLRSRSHRNSCISAYWVSSSAREVQLKFGHIQHFLHHIVTTSNGPMYHVIAVVDWLKKHPDQSYFGSSCYVTQCDHEGIHTYSYIPVQRVVSRCCFGKLTIEFAHGLENVMVIIPTPFKFRIYN